MTFGSYEAETDTIRIHPDLDSRKTPRVFLEYIVYHEMLHVIHPTQVHPSGRRTVHTAAFKRAERRFPHLGEAMRYLEKLGLRLSTRGRRRQYSLAGSASFSGSRGGSRVSIKKP